MTIKRLKAPYDDYGIDSSGTVWSFKGDTKSKVKPRSDKDGYLRVNLADKGASKNGFKEVYIHKLVARAFHGKGAGHVLHKNGNKTDNRAENLQWGSISQNAKQREQHKRERSDADDVDVEDAVAPVWRFDAPETALWEMTPEGYLVAERVVMAEAKIYEYADDTMPEGVRREFVTPQALEALAQSIQGKPVTDEHPTEGKVNSETWRSLARGVIQKAWVEEPTDDNGLAYTSCVAKAVISDKDLIAKILRENIREVSPGYDATLSVAPALPEFQGAHFLQTSRAGNHLAVVRRGRGGSTSSIRLDSAGHVITDNEDTMTPEDQKKLDEAEAARADMQKKLDALQAKVDAFEAAASASKDKQDAGDKCDKCGGPMKADRNDAADFMKLYSERRKVEDTAQRLGVQFDEAAPTAAIKAAIVTAKLPGFRADNADRVDAAFEVVCTTQLQSTPENVADAFRRADSAPKTNLDSGDDIFAAYDRKRG